MFEPVRRKCFYAWLVGLGAVLLAFFFLPLPNGGRMTDSLRNREAAPNGGRPPFSLGRCQMAVWFFLVVSSYVFLWLVLADLDTITASVLTLMGVGSGTALGAGLIDSSKKEEAEKARGDLVTADAAVAAANLTQLPALQQAQTNAQVRVNQTEGVVKPARGSWIADLLKDRDGYAFHRFQIAVWTIVLAIIFVHSIIEELRMPEFSDTLLGLMGISSGTYLGFKFPERHQ